MPEKKKMGRPIIGEPKTIPFNTRVDEETFKKAKLLCEKKGISRSELIRQLIKRAK